MNEFACSKSKIFFSIFWFFIAALFVDVANLDDLIPDTIVVHSDEDNNSQSASQLLTHVSDHTPVGSHSLPQHSQKNETRKPSKHIRIIYDQDSDSLAVDPVLASELFVRIWNETRISFESIKPTHSLYIRNCTLLI